MNKPINMSRRGFLRALGVTSMTLSLGGLWVPPKTEIIECVCWENIVVVKPYAAISIHDVRMAGIEPYFGKVFRRHNAAQAKNLLQEDKA